MRSCYIVSLKYAPGLAKEFKLLGENLQQHGWSVTYVLSSAYAWLLGEVEGEIHYVTRSRSWREVVEDCLRFPISGLPRLRRLFRERAPDLLMFYNPYPLNFVIAQSAKRIYPKGLRTIYLHEPFVPDRSSYGPRRSRLILLAEWLQTLAVRETNCVILPSVHARDLFDMRYPTYQGSRFLAPILLPDRPVDGQVERRYVSLVGNLNMSRGPEDFLALVNLAAEQGADLTFKIVTRSEIADGLSVLSPQARSNLHVVNKPDISDKEIADTLAESYALFLPHKQATQSGNVPIALRAGTPIIARDIPGLSQHVHHKENGFLFPVDPTPEHLLEAALYVRGHFEELSVQARRDFESVFSESNWGRYYAWLLDDGVEDC